MLHHWATQEHILKKVCNQAVLGHHWLWGKKIQWKSMVPQNCSVSHILQNIFLCVQQNKDIHTGLELLKGGGELWQNFHFWVNYPFKTLICCTLCAAELICMWKQSSSVSCCCINSCSIVCEPWSNCLFAFSPELTCCSDSVPSTITSQAGNPSSNPSSLRLPLLIPSQVQSLAPILVDAERPTDIRIWGLFYWSFSSLKGS